MSKKPNFTLSKVKRFPNGGLEAHFITEERDGSEIYQDTHIKKCTKVQHKDLDAALDRLRPHMSRVMGDHWIKAVMTSTELKEGEKKAFDQLQKIIDSGLKTQEDKIEITGISISGKEEKRNVIITAKRYMDNKKVIAINSPLIALNGTVFGFEVDLQQDIDEIIEETEAYLFKGKKAQLDLFDKQEGESKLVPLKNKDMISTSKMAATASPIVN
jgi:hypothetical protein